MIWWRDALHLTVDLGNLITDRVRSDFSYKFADVPIQPASVSRHALILVAASRQIFCFFLLAVKHIVAYKALGKLLFWGLGHFSFIVAEYLGKFTSAREMESECKHRNNAGAICQHPLLVA